ncbi:MAG: tRNA threonylcarbamoyladenosine biosynthesis protein TsaE [Cellvibrionaceae bacterium]|jgi:tRNA threonylcarbamoyladenosine biosynthesis protein TsaE
MKNTSFALKLTSEAVETTEQLGERLGRELKSSDVVCLVGGLGAGKTALTRGIGRGWGTTQRVTSPTFTLMNEYARPEDGCMLYHLDCYRLMSDDDVETIGLEDILAADGVVVIEWPQVANEWLPADHLAIAIETLTENSRELTFTAHGPRSQTILEKITVE